MKGDAVERELLLAAKAVENGLVSPDALAVAVSKWATSGSGSLLQALEETPGLSELDKQQLRSLFAEFHDTLVGQIAESLDDSIFGKLNEALASIADSELKASIANWSEVARVRADEPVQENDRFQIVSAHAQGGLGEVLLAEDRQLNRQVALKRIREKWADNEYARIRFRLEAEVTGRLEHPGVVPVYALGTRDDGQVYYAMRFIRGESLEETVERFHSAVGQHPEGFRSADFRNLIRRLVDVCNTISYGHSKGIIHRDIKPANIMLGRYGESLVVDWGLAKQVDVDEAGPNLGAESIIVPESGSGSAPTQFGSAVGTPQYMSPEQATGRLDRMGPATDVFGLGATLYHLLTNKAPQKSDSVDRILDRVEHGEFARPREVNPAVPGALEAVCLKAMAVRSSDRYGTPDELADELERWLADEPVHVYQDRFAVRAARWVRKNQTKSVVFVLALVVLTCATFAGSFVWSRFQRREFEHQQEIALQQQEAQAAREARFAELSASRDEAIRLASANVGNDQYQAAADVLKRAVQPLSADQQFTGDVRQMLQQSARLEKISDFYRLSEQAQRANYLAQDKDEIIAAMTALNLMNVWQYPDWWNHLPAQDLSPVQHDELRQAVYKQLLLLASTYTKMTALRTLEGVGGEIPDTLSGRMDAIFSKGGKEEARITIRIIDHANRYRYAESLRWFRGIVGMRLLRSLTIPSRWLLDPRNPADAHELGVLTLTQYIVGNLPLNNYRGVSDLLVSARETLGIASEMQPHHYWTHLLLAQCEYLAAEQATENGSTDAWKLYESARQIFIHCIALRPESPFAYTDMSTVCLREHEVIGKDTSLSDEDKDRLSADLLDSCVRNAFHAVTLAPDEPWVYWHHGHALAALGRTDEAMATYSRAIQMRHRFSEDNNESIVDTDRIRGRDRVFTEIQKRIDGGDDRPVYHAVLGAARYSTGEVEAARTHVAEALMATEVPSLAFSVAGFLAREDGDTNAAREYFAKCLSQDPDSFWAMFGQALCEEDSGRYDAALEQFRFAEQLAVSRIHKADALLGQCRSLMRLDQSPDAAEQLVAAREIWPACQLTQILTLGQSLNDTRIISEVNQLQSISSSSLTMDEAMDDCRDVPVLNGNFELEFGKYWHNRGGPAWQLFGPGESFARLDSSDVYGGQNSLFVKTTQLQSDAYAATQQTITVEQNQDYRIDIFTNVKDAQPGGLLIYVTKENAELGDPVIEIDDPERDGSRGNWVKRTGTFRTPRSRRFPVLMPMTLHIVSRGPVEALIDEIVITKVDED